MNPLPPDTLCDAHSSHSEEYLLLVELFETETEKCQNLEMTIFAKLAVLVKVLEKQKAFWKGSSRKLWNAWALI